MRMQDGHAGTSGQGLTLLHLSAQPELFLTQNAPKTPPNSPKHPQNTPSTTPISPKPPKHPLNKPQMYPLCHRKRLRIAKKWTSVSPCQRPRAAGPVDVLPLAVGAAVGYDDDARRVGRGLPRGLGPARCCSPRHGQAFEGFRT